MRGTLLIVGLITISFFNPIHSIGLSVNNYNWIWNELTDSNLPGEVYGDDSVVWGSSLGPYYNSSEAENKLLDAASVFPDIVTFFKYGKSYLGKDLFGVKITAPVDDAIYDKYDVLLVANHHAREAITVMDSLLWMDRLIYDYTNGQTWAVELLKKAVIYIIPVFNPDGLDFTSQNPWQRKNMQPFDGDNDGTLDDDLEVRDANNDGYVIYKYDGSLEGVDLDGDGYISEDLPGGIDLNRNYAYKFGVDSVGSSNDKNDATYRGEYAFQAPETDYFKYFAEHNHFYTSLSLHSGTKAIIYPWGYTNTPSPDNDLFVRITHELQKIVNFPSWQDDAAYPVNGEWGDWMYGALDSIAMTIETYYGPDLILVNNEGYGGIWDYFNPNANEIYNSSMNGVQKHMDYFFTIPESTYIVPKYNISSMNIVKNKDDLTLDFDSLITSNNTIINVEYFNNNTWNVAYSAYLNNGTNSVHVMSKHLTDNEVRVYIGSQSQGRSYYIKDGAYNVKMDGQHVISYSTTINSVDSNISKSDFISINYIFLILPIIAKFIKRNKQAKN